MKSCVAGPWVFNLSEFLETTDFSVVVRCPLAFLVAPWPSGAPTSKVPLGLQVPLGHPTHLLFQVRCLVTVPLQVTVLFWFQCPFGLQCSQQGCSAPFDVKKLGHPASRRHPVPLGRTECPLAFQNPSIIQCPLACKCPLAIQRTSYFKYVVWLRCPYRLQCPFGFSAPSGYGAPTGYSAPNNFSVLSGYGAPSTVAVLLQVPVPLLVSKSSHGVSQKAFAHVQLRTVCAPPYVLGLQ